MLGRIGLFLLTNFLFFVTFSIIMNVFGVGHYIAEGGIQYKPLLIICLVWGMGGSFISLMLSRWMAKRFYRIQIIEPTSAGQYAGLVNMVHQFAKQAGLPAMPEVGVYESPDVNAFATGPTKGKSLVAFSTGILQHMNKDELEGVAAHEVAHIQNGDMVTMALLQGVVNAFVMFLARIIAFVVSERVSEDYRYLARFAITIILDIVIGLLGMMFVAWFSRRREFRADAGSAKLTGREDMIAALQSLQRLKATGPLPQEPASMAAFKISNPKKASLFATHPPLEARIEALQKFQEN